jgi:hypothetical protein
MAGSQLAELQNMRVLLEETRLLTRNLAYHRRAKLEARLELVRIPAWAAWLLFG